MRTQSHTDPRPIVIIDRVDLLEARIASLRALVKWAPEPTPGWLAAAKQLLAET